MRTGCTNRKIKKQALSLLFYFLSAVLADDRQILSVCYNRNKNAMRLLCRIYLKTENFILL